MRSVLFFTSCLVATSCARTDERPPSEPPHLEGALATEPSGSTLESHLFSAELVMDHQTALGLDDAQTSALRADLARAQTELVEAEWSLRREREALASLLANERVDEPSAMAAADRVIEAESTIKRIHLRLLVRIKNRLTPTQQSWLDQLRSAR